MIKIAALDRTPALLIDTRCILGESPRWHMEKQQLYWVDIAANALHRWDTATGAHDIRLFDAPVACFGFRRGDGLILGMKDGCALLDDWDATPVPFGEQMLTGKPHHRLNDGRVDSAGRFWVGSVNSAKDAEDAALYRVDPNGAISLIKSGMTTCNGAAFSGDGRQFVHTDTPSHALRVYDAELGTDTLKNQRLLHQFERGVGLGLGRPDGGSFDAEGCYWSALFDGWRVVRLSPGGEVVREVALPVQRPTMIAFGGEDGCTAFVTSARTGLDDAALAEQPHAGGVLAFRVDVPGVPELQFGG